MAVYILSALLVAVLAVAIYELSKKSEVEEEIKRLKKRSELSLLTELRAAEKVVWLCFTGGLLLTANYAITYFSGAELNTIKSWGIVQYFGAFMGLIVATSITFVQKVLYSSPTHSKAGTLITAIILIFVIVSEIGSPIEKEGMKMKAASQESVVFKAVIQGIERDTNAEGGYSAQIAAANDEKAKHEFELKRCDRHAKSGVKRVKRCQDYESKAIAQAQARIESYKNSANAATRNNESNRLSMIEQAKQLEHNADNHSGIVKLTASLLGADVLSAMMLLSLILITAFEAGFHFVSSRVGMLRAALGEMGNKEILMEEELIALKKRKKFEDKVWNLRCDKAMAIQPIKEASIDRVRCDIEPFKGVDESEDTRSKKASTTEYTRSDSVGLEQNDFDDLYDYLVVMLRSGKVKPTTRPMRKISHEFLKANAKEGQDVLSYPKTNNLVQVIIEKMVSDDILEINPKHKNGTPKYQVKQEEG